MNRSSAPAAEQTRRMMTHLIQTKRPWRTSAPITALKNITPNQPKSSPNILYSVASLHALVQMFKADMTDRTNPEMAVSQRMTLALKGKE
jgi:hypothetical protein